MNEQLTLPLPVDMLDEHGTAFTRRIKQTIDNLEKFKTEIEAALAYGNHSHSFDDIVYKVMLGTVDFYPLENSYMIMEVHTFPKHSTYHGFLAGGHWPEIMAFQPTILEIAKSKGCKYLSISGRHGWTKVMKDYGWQHQYSVCYREV